LIAAAHPLEAVSLILLFICAILYIKSVLEVYGIPYGLDYGEGYLANSSLGLVGGDNPYHPLNREPWIVTSYPPLYPLLNGLIMGLLGRSLLVGRFLATASLIGIIVLSIVLLRKLGVGAAVALIAACLMIAFPWPVKWSQVVRVDTLGILFAIGGLYAWIKSDRIGDTILAAVLFAAAAFTKQSLLAAPAACVLHGLISRDKRSLLLLLFLIILIPGGYLLVNSLTGGGLFLHLFAYTANRFYILRLTEGLGVYFQYTWILQILALASILTPGVTTGQRRVLGWYWLFAHLTLLTYGLTGSDTNYYIEPLLSAALLAALTIDRLISQKEPATGLKISPRSIGYALLITVIITGRFIEPTEYKVHRMTEERLQNGTQLINLCANTPDDVLSEDASYTFLAGKPVIIQPYIMTLLYRTGKWDEEPFVQTIRDGRYSLIILRVDLNDPYNTETRGGAWEIAGFDRWSEGMEQAIMDNYVLFGPVDTGVGNSPWYLYQRKSDIRATPAPLEPHTVGPAN
jgi:hypothetical protein